MADSTNNQLREFACAAPGTVTGTVVSATDTTVTLDAGASAADDAYNNLVLYLYSGPAAYQYRRITDYVGATRVATLGSALAVVPSAGVSWAIFDRSGRARSSTTPRQLVLGEAGVTPPAAASYVGTYVTIIHEGVASSRPIISASSAEVDSVTYVTLVPKTPWTGTAQSDDLYVAHGQRWTLGVTPTSEQVTLPAGASSVDDYYNGAFIQTQSRDLSNVARQVSDYDGATRVATLAVPWDPPATGSDVLIFGGWIGDYTDGEDYNTVRASVDQASSIVPPTLLRLDTLPSVTAAGEPHTEAAYTTQASGTGVLDVALGARYFQLYLLNLGPPFTCSLQTRLSSELSPPPMEQGSATGVQIQGERQGQTVSLQANSMGMLKTVVHPQTVFGDMRTSQSTPVVQLQFVYGLSTQDTRQVRSGGTTIVVTVLGAGGTAQEQAVTLPPSSLLAQASTGSYMLAPSANGTTYVPWFNTGATTEPAVGGTNIEVDVSAATTAAEVAAALRTALNASGNFTVTTPDDQGHIYVVDDTAGAVASFQIGTMPQTGTAAGTVDNSVLTVSSGDADFLYLESRRALQYNPGQGMAVLFTALFSSPAAATTQHAGVRNVASELSFGYNSSQQFVIRRNFGGYPEVRALTVTSAATSGGDVTIVLAGTSHTVTLTTGTTAHVAREITASSTFLSNYWGSFAVGSVVYFYRINTDTLYGITSYSYSAGTTGTAASFSQVRAATAAVSNEIPQSSWNMDTCDGTGPSGFALDPQKGNVYRISWQWLGFGNIFYEIENPDEHEWILAHVEKIPNSQTSPSLLIPHMRAFWGANNAQGSSVVTVQGSSAGGFVEGPLAHIGPRLTATVEKTISTSDETPVLFLTMPETYVGSGASAGIPNLVQAMFDRMSITNDTTRSVLFKLYSQAVPDESAQELSYAFVDQAGSPALVSTTGGLTSGVELLSIFLARECGQVVDLTSLNLVLSAGDTLCVTMTRLANSGNVECSVSLNWHEHR